MLLLQLGNARHCQHPPAEVASLAPSTHARTHAEAWALRQAGRQAGRQALSMVAAQAHLTPGMSSAICSRRGMTPTVLTVTFLRRRPKRRGSVIMPTAALTAL